MESKRPRNSGVSVTQKVQIAILSVQLCCVLGKPDASIDAEDRFIHPGISYHVWGYCLQRFSKGDHQVAGWGKHIHFILRLMRIKPCYIVVCSQV